MSIAVLPDWTDVPKKFCPAPFWSWNSELEPDELRKQIRGFAEAGMGGFFMHARGGLTTEYLSADWIKCVEACLDEASKLGMDAWLYDENGWPSGFGGGLVNGLGETYQQKYLNAEKIAPEAAAADRYTIAFYDCNTLQRLSLEEAKASATPVWRCFYDLNPFYVDNLDAKIVQKFLEVTHQFYYENIRPDLRKHLRGIFTDEPQLSRRGILWSLVLEAEYAKAYPQHNLADELILLFVDRADAPEMRIRFWNLVARLFAKNFLKQIYDWCEEHHWELTGHHVMEESYISQLTSNGSIMTQYPYYHVPGMDHLCRNEPSVITMMQVTSVAAQTQKQQILTESFALTGWNFNFSGMKWMYQIQLAHGINYLCPHLVSYSLKGLRKRDYPGSWGPHQPWFHEFSQVLTPFARVGKMLAEGEIASDILVLHGESSAWTIYENTVKEGCGNRYGECYTRALELLSQELDGKRLRYHYGDEVLMQDMSSCSGATIQVGACSYSLVIIPQVNNLSRCNVELLRTFQKAGGRVLAVRNQLEPNRLMVDGKVASAADQELFQSFEWFDTERALVEKVAPEFPRVVVTADGVETPEILCARRQFGTMHTYYLVNKRYNFRTNCELTLPETADAALYEVSIETGKRTQLAFTRNAKHEIVLAHEFGEAGALWLEVVPQAEATAPKAEKLAPTSCKLTLPTDHYTLHLDEQYNYLTLDRCRFRIDDDEFVYDDVSVIQTRALEKGKDCVVTMQFDFTCAADFALTTPLFAIVEDPEQSRFALNGVVFEAQDCGEAFDPAFRLIALPGNLLRSGKNTLELVQNFTQSPAIFAALERARQFESEANKLTFHSEIEAIYLAGKFAVRTLGLTTEPVLKHIFVNELTPGVGMSTAAERRNGPFEIAPLKSDVVLDDLTGSGLPFFKGTLTLSREIDLDEATANAVKSLNFDLNGFNSCELLINNVSVGKRYYGKWEISIPQGMLKAGKNTIAFRVVQSLRNLLGPFHLAEGESGAVMTTSFNKYPNYINQCAPAYDEAYCLVKLGVLHAEFRG